ncbi:MAG: hypothetical protein HQ558_01265, partial [Candidatus Omnitrophica bacterium]|nr:hypothetical protein [Candidatus Omnitrophota bacterium]
TCIYKDKAGPDALKQLHVDFSDGGEFLSGLSGGFCLIIYKNRKLYILNDYTGLYRIYCDEPRTILSSSLLAVSGALKQKTVSPQELYEYVINGAFYGDRTPIKEIKLLDSKYIWQVSPATSGIPKTLKPKGLGEDTSFDEMVGEVSESLIGYFAALKEAFGSSVCSALSGGFDTRLMLSLMRKVGIKPYLYVYGGKDCEDVKIAKTIAESEGLNLDHIDKNEFPQCDKDRFRELIKRQYYIFDGLPNFGIFDNGSDANTRIGRTEKAKLQLNGCGGEIFRNFWNLPEGSFDIVSFLKSKYDFIDYSILGGDFNKDNYFLSLADKVKYALDTDNDRIDRRQVEMLYPYFRLKYWLGINNSINNQFAYALVPYADTRFIFQSFDIPLKFKNLGLFEAALIRYIDPALAKYPSIYGFNFSGKPGPLAWAKYFAKISTPISLRPLIRRRLLYRSKATGLPFYLKDEYVKTVFPLGNLNISKYINLEKIDDPVILSRALSAELLITEKF